MMLMYGGPPQGRGGRHAREVLERIEASERDLRRIRSLPFFKIGDWTIPGLATAMGLYVAERSP